MAITKEQIIDLGFQPAKRKSPYAKNYDTLIFHLTTDKYLYLGYNVSTKHMDFKRIWVSCVDADGKRMTYQLSHIGEISYRELKEFIENNKDAKI